MSGTPESFQSIRDLFVIHTHQMLKLDRKPPIYGVALLVAVACEVLAKVLPDAVDAEEIFAREFAVHAPRHVGRLLYEALRNGLAHTCDPYPIVVGNETVRLVLAWKGGPHLRVVGLRHEEGHNQIVPLARNETPTPFVCLVVADLQRDLVRVFDRTAQRLAADAELAELVDERVRNVQNGGGLKKPGERLESSERRSCRMQRGRSTT